jgi:NAD(P)-dependent dehydrogenase (short-subunit alcohol dehydrogenase family)
MISLQGKNIIVTGASSGIGRSCAILASRVGANVALIGRNQERLQETYNQLDNGNHHYVSQDITEYANLESLLSDCCQKIGNISGFVHSAGIESTVPLRSIHPEIYHTLFSINVISAFEISKLLIKKKLLKTSGASFVFISSVMGLLGQKGKTAYSSSKSALIGGARSMALELAPKKMRVNCISPGVVSTEMSKKLFEVLPESSKEEIIRKHPLGIGDPEDIANACLFLLSDLSKWITGTNLIVDGGYSAE